MQSKLHENDHKTGWRGLELLWLLHRLKQEVSELERELRSSMRTIREVTREAADVANFAMMIADNIGGLESV